MVKQKRVDVLRYMIPMIGNGMTIASPTPIIHDIDVRKETCKLNHVVQDKELLNEWGKWAHMLVKMQPCKKVIKSIES